MSLRRTIPVLLVAAVTAVGVSEFAQGAPELSAPPLGQTVAELGDARKQIAGKLKSSPRVLGVPRKQLESIAECESHGDPRAVSSDGTYRGKYQFDRSTWHSNGGSGDPAKAPELEQDLRAAQVMRIRGSSPWPNCG